MTDKNKPTKRPKNSDDPVIDKRRSVSVRRSHEGLITASQQINDNFSGFVGALMDDYFKSSQENPSEIGSIARSELTLLDVITLIGNGVSRSDVTASIFAWLDGNRVHSIRLEDRKKLDLYNSLRDIIDNHKQKTSYIDDFCEETINNIHHLYLELKHTHLNFYMSTILDLKKRGTNPKVRLHASYAHNNYVNMEYNHVTQLCDYSPIVRFSVMRCWENQFLRKPVRNPDWIVANRQLLMAMNTPIPLNPEA